MLGDVRPEYWLQALQLVKTFFIHIRIHAEMKFTLLYLCNEDKSKE
jgi:hypothetical protein